jgi:uncharacterized protein YciI
MSAIKRAQVHARAACGAVRAAPEVLSHIHLPAQTGVHVHYLLIYDLAPDYLERRAEFRNEHLRLAWEAQERGEIVLAGALDEPADRAMLLFRCDSPQVPQLFAAKDPYVTHGLVRAFHVRPWNTVVGDMAATPVRPE